MHNLYEFIHNFNASNPDDAFEDADNDGLTNLEEFINNTDPWVADSDGDKISDGDEIKYDLDPLDPTDAEDDLDNDFIPNEFEINNDQYFDPKSPASSPVNDPVSTPAPEPVNSGSSEGSL